MLLISLSARVLANDRYSTVLLFRYHWHWRRPERDQRIRRALLPALQLRGDGRELSINEMDDASASATSWLNRHGLRVEVDFPSGRINLRPETLLDWLVLSLIECRRNLAICANENCPTPYFVKTHPRARYCSLSCSGVARQAGQRRWEQANRSADSKRFGNRKKG